jgi:hypothetical protein
MPNGSEILGGWGFWCFERRKVRDQEAIVCQTQQAEPSAQRKKKQERGEEGEGGEKGGREREWERKMRVQVWGWWKKKLAGGRVRRRGFSQFLFQGHGVLLL